MPENETWNLLKKGGSAGLYIVVMALSWWVATLKAESDDSQAWDIVNDVTWVLSSAMPTSHPTISNSGIVKRALPDTLGSDITELPPSKWVLMRIFCILIVLTFLLSDASSFKYDFGCGLLYEIVE